MIPRYLEISAFPSEQEVSPDTLLKHLVSWSDKTFVYLDDYDPRNTDHMVLAISGSESTITHALPLLQHLQLRFEYFTHSDRELDQRIITTVVKAGGRVQWLGKSQSQADTKNVLANFQDPHFRWIAPEDNVNAVTGPAATLNCRPMNEQSVVERPTTSVIVVNYNLGRFLKDALDSVLLQSVPADEIIVVDDCSFDNSLDILKRYEDHLVLIRNETNIGVANSRKKAIASAGGDIIYLLDADDRLRGDYIEKTLPYFIKDKGTGVVYTDVILFGPRASWRAGGFHREGRTKVTDLGPDYYRVEFPEFGDGAEGAIKTFNFIHNSSPFRRSAYLAVGGYQPTSIPEDWYLFMQMILAGWKARRCPFPLLEYRQHSLMQDQGVRWLEALERQFTSAVQRVDRLEREVSALKRHFADRC